MIKNKSYRNPWAWVPSLYFAEGLPYIIVMSLSVIMYKRLEVSNTDIALYTSWLYLPWVIKPFWSPVVDLIKTKRWWIVTMQLLIGAGLAGVGLTLPMDGFFKYTLIFFWLVAFSSATHDIAADGFYMIGLTDHHQAFFVGIRSTFYRLAMITGQGLLVIFAGLFEESLGNVKTAWFVTMLFTAGIYAVLFVYHKFVLPKPVNDSTRDRIDSKLFIKEFISTFVKFFQKKKIFVIILFILFYRLGEGQLAKLAAPFLLDNHEVGGLALTTTDVGFVYGTIGIFALVIGGLLGGFLAARNGLKYWIWWMLAAINLPNVVYVIMSLIQPESLILISSFIALEQFGYGFGFTAFMLYLIYISEGEHKTSHYAIATGLMALGMMVPGMISGWIQESIGYPMFFIWVLVSTLPAFIITAFLDIDENFGKKVER